MMFIGELILLRFASFGGQGRLTEKNRQAIGGDAFDSLWNLRNQWMKSFARAGIGRR